MNKQLTTIYQIATVTIVIALAGSIISGAMPFAIALLIGSGGYLYSIFRLQRCVKSFRHKRLASMAVLAGIIMIAGSTLQLMNQPWWKIIFIVAVILMVYSNLSLSRVMDANKKQSNNQG